jgi:hypothetical protein
MGDTPSNYAGDVGDNSLSGVGGSIACIIHPPPSTLHAPVAQLDRVTGFVRGGVPRGGHPLRISPGAPIIHR